MDAVISLGLGLMAGTIIYYGITVKEYITYIPNKVKGFFGLN